MDIARKYLYMSASLKAESMAASKKKSNRGSSVSSLCWDRMKSPGWLSCSAASCVDYSQERWQAGVEEISFSYSLGRPGPSLVVDRVVTGLVLVVLWVFVVVEGRYDKRGNRRRTFLFLR